MPRKCEYMTASVLSVKIILVTVILYLRADMKLYFPYLSIDLDDNWCRKAPPLNGVVQL